jgi:outer membrane protein assembly factor BamA
MLIGRRTTWALTIVAVCAVGSAVTQAQAPTRADEARAEREQKARELKPHSRSAVERLLFKLEDDLLLERWLDPPRGVHVRLGGIGEGAGFGVGPAFRYNAPRFDFKTSAAMSMKNYRLLETSVRFPGTLGHNVYIRPDGPYVQLDGRYRDFPQEDFFGLGPDSSVEARSNYALTDTVGRATAGFERGLFNAGIGAGYQDISIGEGEDSRFPSATAIFPPSQLPGSEADTQFLVLEPFVEYSSVDRAINRRSGGVYRLSAAQYRDQTSDSYSFRRWEADLRQFIGFEKDTRSLALRAWAVSTTPDDGGEVPFYLQPTLGGARSLRGYRTFRFRDRSALLLQAEYRWRINEFVHGALFYDTGAVASSLKEIGRLERNYGFGLRAGGRMGSAFRLDFAFGGREGRRYLLRFDDAF